MDITLHQHPSPNPTAKEHRVTTSTPHINDNYSDKSLPSWRIESIVPRQLFPMSDEVNTPQSEPEREKEGLNGHCQNPTYAARTIN